MRGVTAFILRIIARACLVVGERAAPGTSRERQGYHASMMLEHAAAQLDGSLHAP
jgi:hypothetical protein